LSFLYPEFLYFILPIVFVLFGFLLTQKEIHQHFFSDEVMERLTIHSNGLTLKRRNGLFFLSSIFLVIALAGPIIKEGTIEIKAKSADIMIALDISDSMLAQDVYPNRLKASKQKMIDLLKIASEERIGVIAFAKNSYLVSPLSFDHGAVSFLLKQLNTDSITEKGTDFLSVLNVVNSSIKKESKKYLLLFTDGGDSKDFSKEIAFAKEKNIVVFIIGMGTIKGAPIKLNDGSFIKQNGVIIISKLNDKISDLATKTGGVYIKNVNSTDDIKAMKQEINRISEKKELRSEEINKFIPLFYYPLAFALFILLIATSSFSKQNLPKFLTAFILITLLAPMQNAQAGFLDFMELESAKEAYSNGEYEKSQKLYGKYASTTKSGDSYYNEGNAFYKQGKFKEAIKSYEKATFDEDILKAKKYSNMGNSYVKSQEPKSLEKAVEMYEKSLKLNDDKDTKENLEAVKKVIEEQKKKEEEKKKKDNKDKDKNKKKDDKKSDKKDDKEKKDGDKDKKSDKKDKSDKDSQKKDEKSSEDKKDSDKKESEKSKEDKKKESEDSNKTKEQKPKDDLEKLNKDNNSSKSQQEAGMKKSQEIMSDAEQAKWLKQLNSQQNTYMYMLNKQKYNKEDSNEKPW